MLGRLAFIGALALTMFFVGKVSAVVVGGEGPSRASASRLIESTNAPPVMVLAHGDAEMDAAHARAKKSISDFWAALDRQNAGEKNFSLKVRFPVAGQADSGEHVWVLDVQRSDGAMYSGRLDNKPKFLPDMQIGDRVTFSEDMISDWMFTRNSKIVGNESMRPILARMPKAKADKLRALLENP